MLISDIRIRNKISECVLHNNNNNIKTSRILSVRRSDNRTNLRTFKPWYSRQYQPSISYMAPISILLQYKIRTTKTCISCRLSAAASLWRSAHRACPVAHRKSRKFSSAAQRPLGLLMLWLWKYIFLKDGEHRWTGRSQTVRHSHNKIRQ